MYDMLTGTQHKIREKSLPAADGVPLKIHMENNTIYVVFSNSVTKIVCDHDEDLEPVTTGGNKKEKNTIKHSASGGKKRKTKKHGKKRTMNKLRRKTLKQHRRGAGSRVSRI